MAASTAAASTEAPSVPHSRVYTKTGDTGASSLYNGVRRDKDDVVFCALGDVDELNASLGLAREHCAGLAQEQSTGGGAGVGAGALASQLVEVQSRLLDVGSAVATPASSSRAEQLARVAFSPAHTDEVEGWIDVLDAALPPLTNFILPGGGLAAAHLHVARTVCRRAERSVAALARDGHVPRAVAVYLNRLSDYLFVAARAAAAATPGAVEAVYKKGTPLLERAAAARQA